MSGGPVPRTGALPSLGARWGRDGVRSLTQYGRWALGMAVVVAALGFLRGDVWMYFIALLSLASVVVSWVAVPRLPELDVRLIAPAVEVVGEPTPVQLEMRSGARPVVRQRLSLHVFGDAPGRGALPVGVDAVVEAMGPRGTQTVDLVLRPEMRGVHDGYVLTRWTSAPFGLVRRTAAVRATRRRTVSAGLQSAGVGPAVLHGEGDHRQVRVARDGTDVHALRGWTTGDGSSVHWRSTARRNTPVVVDRETPETTGLVVVAAAAGPGESADAVVAWAAGTALAAASQGGVVHLVSASGPIAVGRHDRDALLQWAASAQPASPDGGLADHAAALAGPGGLVAVMHGQGCHDDAWPQAARAAGADVVDFAVHPRSSEQAEPAAAPALTRPLALATLASLLGGVWCVTATGALSGTGALAAAAVLVAVAAAGLLHPPTSVDPRVRTGASLVLLLLTGALAVHFADPEAMNLAPAAVVGLCGVSAAQVVGARSRRDGLVALGLGPLLVIVAAGLAPGPALVLPALLVAGSVLVGLSTCVDDADPASARPSAPVPWAPAVASVALGVVAFLLLPLGSAASLGTSLLGERQTQLTPAQVAAQQTPAYFGGSLDLSARGHLSDNTALEVEPGAPPLWRAMTLDTVQDDAWTAQPVQQELDARAGAIALPRDPSDSGAPEGSSRSYAVRPVDASTIVAPGAATSISGLGAVWQQQASSYVVLGDLAPYTVSAVTSDSIDTLTRSGSGTDRTEPVYVELDPSTTTRTRELAASITAGMTDRVQKVHAIESWLRANIRYQLDAPLPPAGQNAVDFLLFDSQAGFCEHFAAAETIMLRSLGIPSRLATGYSAGSGITGADGWTVVRDSDAHAWVEVWVPGHGWVTSDPTAGSTLADASSEQNVLQRALSAWTLLWTTDSGRRALAVAVLLVVGLAALSVVLVRRRRTAPLGLDASRAAALPEPLPAFARLRSAMVVDGVRIGPGDGVGEVRRAAQGDRELLAALLVVERTLYDRTRPGTEERLAAAEVLDRRAAAHLAHAAAVPTP